MKFFIIFALFTLFVSVSSFAIGGNSVVVDGDAHTTNTGLRDKLSKKLKMLKSLADAPQADETFTKDKGLKAMAALNGPPLDLSARDFLEMLKYELSSVNESNDALQKIKADLKTKAVELGEISKNILMDVNGLNCPGLSLLTSAAKETREALEKTGEELKGAINGLNNMLSGFFNVLGR